MERNARAVVSMLPVDAFCCGLMRLVAVLRRISIGHARFLPVEFYSWLEVERDTLVGHDASGAHHLTESIVVISNFITKFVGVQIDAIQLDIV